MTEPSSVDLGPKPSVFGTLSNWGVALIAADTSTLLWLSGSTFHGVGFPLVAIALFLLTCVWLLFCVAVMLGNRSSGGWRLPLTMVGVLAVPVVLDLVSSLLR